MGLKFKYCECGCHGSLAEAGAESWWLYTDLRGGFELHKGHGHSGRLMGTYRKRNEAVEDANRDAERLLKKMQQDLA
jgi:hypothetical protein